MGLVDPQRVLAGLVDVAEQLGIEVKSTALRGTHPSAGGLCRINGKSVVLLNSKASPVDRGFALAQVLQSLDLDGLELDQELLSYIAQRREKKAVVAPRIAGPGLASAGPSRRKRRALP
ncbi:MAG TPA: hypothetical protein VGP93_12960 [Polyangiaceae bacterium]|jgi:hypothetical protein|nr:hypothetical protein [Polyangiaceae bacterium]